MSFEAIPIAPGMLHDAASRIASEIGNQNASQFDAITQMGWAAILVAEAQGGAEAGLAELAAIVEPLGRSGQTLPILSRCVCAPLWLTAANEAHRFAALANLADGNLRPATLRPADPGVPCTAITNGAGLLQLSGHWRSIGHDVHANAALLLCIDAGIPSLYQMPLACLPTGNRVQALDGQIELEFQLDSLAIGPAQLVAQGSPLEDALAHAEAACMLLTAVDSLGAIGAAIELTIAHLDQRVQFGVALSSFQALRHRVVECYVMYEAARGLILETLHEAQTHGRDAQRAVRLCKLYLDQVGRQVAHASIQYHGAMGMSEETTAARLAKRLIANEYRGPDRLSNLSWLTRAGLPIGASA